MCLSFFPPIIFLCVLFFFSLSNFPGKFLSLLLSGFPASEEEAEEQKEDISLLLRKLFPSLPSLSFLNFRDHHNFLHSSISIILHEPPLAPPLLPSLPQGTLLLLLLVLFFFLPFFVSLILYFYEFMLFNYAGCVKICFFFFEILVFQHLIGLTGRWVFVVLVHKLELLMNYEEL